MKHILEQNSICEIQRIISNKKRKITWHAHWDWKTSKGSWTVFPVAAASLSISWTFSNLSVGEFLLFGTYELIHAMKPRLQRASWFMSSIRSHFIN